MKKNKMTKLALALGTVATVAAPIAAVVSCGGDEATKASVSKADILADAKAKAILDNAGTFSKDTIRIIGHKREVAAQSKAAVAQFNAAFGTNLVIEQIGGSTDYGQYLSTKFSDGAGDVGLVGLEQLGDAKTIGNYIYNTTASDMIGVTKDEGSLTVDGVKNGTGDNKSVEMMSAASEGLGVIFNKDVFNKDGLKVDYAADIPAATKAKDDDGFDQATGTVYANALSEQGYKDLAAALHAKGTAPFYSTFKVNGNDIWPVTNHLLSSAMKVNGVDDSMLTSTTDAKVAISDDVTSSVQTALDIYKSAGSIADAASSVDEAMAYLATGQVAMVQNGTWAYDQLKSVVSSPNVGFLPMPVFKDNKAKFMKGTTQKWVLTTNDTAKKATVSMFLKWLYTTDTGVTALEADFGSITPYAGLANADAEKVTNSLIDSAGKLTNPTGGGLALGKLPEGFNNGSEALRKAFISGTFDQAAAITEFTRLQAAKTTK